ncbi:MAG: GNAT family N-acetyltransferase [Eubacteriales bacterium]|nr:GNAT family N-acetyltransferase [Eubacteriales bacterium]
MTNQEKWIAYCAKHDAAICIFNKPFWLDAVCNGRTHWDVFLVEENGKIEAALPFYKKTRMGFRYITMPLITPHNGIWLKPVANEKNEKRITREYRLYKLLIEQIEASGNSLYQQCYSTEVNNWHPFCWSGYSQKTLYTFCIDCPNNLQEAEKNFGKSTRQNIRKAYEAGTVSEFGDVALFHQINSTLFACKHAHHAIDLPLLERVYQACKEHDAIKLLCAKDEAGTICSVLMLVHDAVKVHALMCASLPEKRSLNFDTLLKYEGIKFACETGRKFDFEGSMIEGVANCMLRFGAEMRPYYLVRKVFVKTPIIRQYLKYRIST